ncbi:MAG: IS256 family transposase [Candidatus Algichlamydia australiensis]|nr:IS256 family transposase [Chlamydiales bacterium]
MNKKVKFDLEKEMQGCKTMEDLIGINGLVQKLIGGMVEQMLEQELEDHLGYAKHDSLGDGSGNSRNGRSSKTVHSSSGPVPIQIPRDRNGDFEPQIVKKGQRSISSFDEKIISMYARGLSTRDIQEHVMEIYGANISPTSISNITNKVMDVAREWQSRPLERVYPIVYFDAIHFKVRQNGKVVSKAAYTCLGIDLNGKKDVLGLWIGESEGARFWLGVFTELKNRGVEDIFIACIDGLKGLPDAIQSIFPETEVQLCVIHMIRNSIKYVAHKNSKEFMADLKPVYRAVSEEQAETKLLEFQEKWSTKYPLALQPWIRHWENIKTFFKFPEEIRRVIYTTNAVESLHRQFRKTTKTRSVFPNSDALLKMLFLTVRGLSEKWTVMPVRNWRSAVSQFAILYGKRAGFDLE